MERQRLQEQQMMMRTYNKQFHRNLSGDVSKRLLVLSEEGELAEREARLLQQQMMMQEQQLKQDANMFQARQAQRRSKSSSPPPTPDLGGRQAAAMLMQPMVLQQQPSQAMSYMPQLVAPAPPARPANQVLVLHGPDSSKQLTSSETWQTGRGSLGLANDQRISRKHIEIRPTQGGWTVTQKSANPSWVRSKGDDYVVQLEKGAASHPLRAGDTVYLVAQEDSHAIRIEFRAVERTAVAVAPAERPPPTPAESPQPMEETMVAIENPLARANSRTPFSASKPPRQPAFDHLVAPGSPRGPVKGDELIDDMVMKEVVPIKTGEIRFGEIFFEETRRVTPYLYVPKGVPLEQVLPAMIRCFQLKPPSSVLDVLPSRSSKGHDHYMQWSLDVLKDEAARQTWRWQDEEAAGEGDGEETHRQQCMRQFGTQLVEAAAEVVKAVDDSGGWFCSKAGRDASQQLLGHAIDEANAGTGEYTWLAVACVSRLCWSKQLRKCSRALNKSDAPGKPEVKRRVRYPSMHEVFPDNATRWDRNLEQILGGAHPEHATREQLQWSLVDPHVSHLVVFEDPDVEDQLREWATTGGLDVETEQSLLQANPAEAVEVTQMGLEKFSLTPDSFVGESPDAAVFLDYWRLVNPTEGEFWTFLRQTMLKLDVRVGCLLTNAGDSEMIRLATENAEDGFPVIVLEEIGSERVKEGIEGDKAKEIVKAEEEMYNLEVEEAPDAWIPKTGIGAWAAKHRVNFHAAATGQELPMRLESPRKRDGGGASNKSYKQLAFGMGEPEPEPWPEEEYFELQAPPFGLQKGSSSQSLPDDSGPEEPAAASEAETRVIAIEKGPEGYGFAIDDKCVVTSVSGAAKGAGVPISSRIVAVFGNSVGAKADVIVQLRAHGADATRIELTFQMPEVPTDLRGTKPSSVLTPLPPPRPVKKTPVKPRAVKFGPQVLLRLVRVKVSDPVYYTSVSMKKRLREALQLDASDNRKNEKQERAYDKQVVGQAWVAYGTLRYNALQCKQRDDKLQMASQLLHVFIAVTACITISLEIPLEGLSAWAEERIMADGAVNVWEPKNSRGGNMDDFWPVWITHFFNFVGPCVLICIIGLQADWSDDVRWGGHLLRAERLRAAIFSYRGRVGDWALPAIARGGWWHEQLAATHVRPDGAQSENTQYDHELAYLAGIAAKTRERNRERLNALQEETLTAAMTRASNHATEATIPAVMITGCTLAMFGTVLFLLGCHTELQFDDRPLAILLVLCGLTGIAIGVIVVKPLANQAHQGKSRDMKPLRQPSAEYMKTCAPPFHVSIPLGGEVSIVGGGSENAEDGTDQAFHAKDINLVDQGYAKIGPEQYLQFRAYPLRAELGQLGPQLSARLRKIQRMLFVSSFASAFCAIGAPLFERHLAIWVCLFNTIGCSVLVYSHRTSARELACAANTTCVTLDACLDWWLTLPPAKKSREGSFERLVADVERAVEVLSVVWTRSELELPRPSEEKETDVALVHSEARDKDTMLRKMVQPRGGKFLL